MCVWSETDATCRRTKSVLYANVQRLLHCSSLADLKILKGGGAEDKLSAPSSFIANTYNEIYAFYTEKSGFLEKNTSQ